MTAKQTGLKLADDLTLPLDLVVEATVLVGKRGRGKTYCGKRIVEQAHGAKVTVAVIDPTDVWYGLQSGSDGGEAGGLDFLIVGGPHGDLPANPGSGKMLARLVREGTSLILVTKGLPKAERRRLVGEFLTELYDNADGTPILVVIDEADEYAPEGVKSFGNRRDDPLMLSSGAVEDIVRRGRAGGLGCLLITQRVAVLSKDVLTQADTLIALGVTGKTDIDAVAGWISRHAPDVETGKEITASLPSLPKGTCWVWSPEYGVLAKVEVLPIATFDSSASPKVGEVAAVPKGRKVLDLGALGEEMARFAAELKAEDPAVLRKRVAELERELATMANEADARYLRIEALEAEVATHVTVEPERIEVPVLSEDLLIRLEEALEPVGVLMAEVGERLTWETENRGNDIAFTRRKLERTPPPPPPPMAVGRPARPVKATARPVPLPTPLPPEGRNTADSGHLSTSQSAILDALAWFESVRIMAPTRGQVAFQSGVSPKSSGYEKNLSTMRTRGLIDYPLPNRLGLTELGQQAADPPAHPATSESLQASIKSRLSESQGTMLTVLIDVYPDPVTREDLADACLVSPRSSGFEKNCSTLRTLGLVDYPAQGLVCATEMLFLD